MYKAGDFVYQVSLHIELNPHKPIRFNTENEADAFVRGFALGLSQTNHDFSKFYQPCKIRRVMITEDEVKSND